MAQSCCIWPHGVKNALKCLFERNAIGRIVISLRHGRASPNQMVMGNFRADPDVENGAEKKRPARSSFVRWSWAYPVSAISYNFDCGTVSNLLPAECPAPYALRSPAGVGGKARSGGGARSVAPIAAAFRPATRSFTRNLLIVAPDVALGPILGCPTVENID